LVDAEYSTTIVVVSFPAEISIEKLEVLVGDINDIASHTYLPHNGRVSLLTGQDVVTVEVNKLIMGTQASSLFTELLLILACLIIGFGSTRIGFLSLIPVLFVIAWEPGALVMLSIPLSVINVTVACIIVSTGIDYGIIITQRLKEEREKGFSKIDALKTTMETSGWSIVTASSTTMVALLATFAVNIPMLHQFSIIVIVLYTFSVIAAFCIIPALYASKLMK
jgi:predicted RND superfamily exporter protein